MLLDWMESCSCMVLWPPRACRAQLYACSIGRREWVAGQAHTAHTRQSATVDASNDMRPERRSGRQRETAKPDITSFCDHQTKQHPGKEGRCSSNTAHLGSLSRQINLWACRAGEMQSGPSKNLSWLEMEPHMALQKGLSLFCSLA